MLDPTPMVVSSSCAPPRLPGWMANMLSSATLLREWILLGRQVESKLMMWFRNEWTFLYRLRLAAHPLASQPSPSELLTVVSSRLNIYETSITAPFKCHPSSVQQPSSPFSNFTWLLCSVFRPTVFVSGNLKVQLSSMRSQNLVTPFQVKRGKLNCGIDQCIRFPTLVLPSPVTRWLASVNNTLNGDNYHLSLMCKGSCVEIVG